MHSATGNTEAILNGLRQRVTVPPTDGPAVKKLQTKTELRAILERETRRFLDTGGHVERVPAGTSGRDPTATLYTPTSLFNEPRPTRTPVPEVIAAIEARRQAMRQHTGAQRRRGRAPPGEQRVIYDDFGEPVRRIWDNKS